jgi:hypothetical protein
MQFYTQDVGFWDCVCHNEQSCQLKSRLRGYFWSWNRGLGPLRKVVELFFFWVAGPTNYLTPSHGIAARDPLGLIYKLSPLWIQTN